MPTADLDTLRRYVGAVSTKDDQQLAERLGSARAWIEDRVYPDSVGTDPVEEAILLLANRLYKRRNSPEGTAGFGGEGVIVRIMASDPDIRALIERHLDMSDGLDDDDIQISTGLGIG